jgi:phosphoglycolate phosphatase
MLVLFDFDGTLVDSEGLISATMADAFTASGLEAPSRAAVRAVIGLSTPEMVRSLLGPDQLEFCEKTLCSYRFRFADAIERQSEPPTYLGAERALYALRQAGVTLGIVSGKSALGLDHDLDALQWRPYFATVHCADENPSKPDPAMVLKALARTGIPAEEALVVGDTSFDMQMARAAGVRAVGVAWGYQSALQLTQAGAETVVADFPTLLKLLLGAGA